MIFSNFMKPQKIRPEKPLTMKFLYCLNGIYTYQYGIPIIGYDIPNKMLYNIIIPKLPKFFVTLQKFRTSTALSDLCQG